MSKEISYIVLACLVLGIQEDTLLAKREYDDHVVVINAAGQKFKFSFEYLEDYQQYLADNKPEAVPRTTNKGTAAKKTTSTRSKSSTRSKKTKKSHEE